MSGAGCVILAVAIVVSMLLDGLVLRALWGWFVVPTFGIPALTLVQAIGIGLIVSLLIMTQGTQSTKSFEDQAIDSLGWTIVKPLMFLFLGYIVYLFI